MRGQEFGKTAALRPSTNREVVEVDNCVGELPYNLVREICAVWEDSWLRQYTRDLQWFASQLLQAMTSAMTIVQEARGTLLRVTGENRGEGGCIPFQCCETS